MTLASGTRVGPYEITGTLGVGGMGEVYRARDPRLGRDVALKVLPALFAADPERLARFQREAQVLAALKHPNIGAIYGLEEGTGEGGVPLRALVLELVEGDTLADRIAHVGGPEGLPLRASGRNVTGGNASGRFASGRSAGSSDPAIPMGRGTHHREADRRGPAGGTRTRA